jgi:integrase/recombinase XerD
MSRELKNFIEYLIKNGLSKNSIDSYRRDLTQFEEFLDKPIIESKSEDVLEFLGNFDKKRTINRKLSSINAFFRYAYKNELTDKKVKLTQTAPQKEPPKYLTKDEIMNGIALIDTTFWLGLRDKVLILLLYATGIKVSEAMNLKIDDIKDGWLYLKDRTIPVANVVVELLEEYLYKRPIKNEYIFINNKGKKLSRISAFNITKKYLNVPPHTLRDSFASSLILAGADLRVVKELLGHKNIINTKIYIDLQKDDTADILQYHPLKDLDETDK